MVDTSGGRVSFVFPGQGSQKVGMGRDWAEAHAESRQAFEEADRVLGFSLSELCWEGPEEELRLTANTQPAILATSVAMHRAVAAAGFEAWLAAGHSLGEYSALVAAGVLAFPDALRLVRRRGELMQEAVPVGRGAMAAVLGLAAEQVEEAVASAARDQVCSLANLNSPGQTVIAGDREAVERAVAAAKSLGARRAALLPVSAPFHCPLMRPARESLEPLLRDTRFRDPALPVVCNVDAEVVTSGQGAREALIRQVESPVLWVESVERMVAGGVETFVEIGPGSVLTGLIRRINPGVEAFSLNAPGDLDMLAEKREDEA